MLKLGILVSGGGSNLQAIIDSVKSGYLNKCSIVTVVGSKDGIYALERAAQNNIPSKVISRKQYSSLDEYDKTLADYLESYEVDLVVMAGFLSIVGGNFVKRFTNRIINIHPSLIPAFCGKGYYGIIPHQKALEYGVKITGATVHFVELETDSGPIIMQKAVEVKPDDTAEVLQRRVMEQAEWHILPESIKLISENSLKVEGRKVIY